VVFSTTMHTLRQAITKNISDIIVTLFLMLMIVLIFTYGQFDYYVNNYTGPFGNNNSYQPCISMYTCYLSTLSYGMRQGGGIGEVTSPIVYPSPGYQSKTAFDVGFFFTINMIALNIIFGIIIDTFGQLRDEDAEREDAYRNYCMICGVAKTDFEAEGINFNMHVREQHLINDYMSFMIRLYINRNNLQHDLDYQIYQKFTKYNVSWFPNKDTLYVSSLAILHSKRGSQRRAGD
jgi:Ion transport protein